MDGARKVQRMSIVTRSKSTPAGDALGICMAGACAIHCVAGPAVVASLPAIGIELVSARVEWMFLLLSFGTSAMVLVRGCFRTHHQKWALIPFAVGAAALVAVRLIVDPDGRIGEWTVIGATVLVLTAHILNLRLCRRSGSECGAVPHMCVPPPPALPGCGSR
jgi:hypothetical protein